MAFKWDANWNQKDQKGYANNVGKYTKEQLTPFLKATTFSSGDDGLRLRLSQESGEITILKGLHDKDEHVTVLYSGGTWHVNLVGTATGGYRVGKVTQWKA